MGNGFDYLCPKRPPVNVVTGQNPFPGTAVSGTLSVQRPDLVAGVPVRIADPTVAGGWRINPKAFTTTLSTQLGIWDAMPCAGLARRSCHLARENKTSAMRKFDKKSERDMRCGLDPANRSFGRGTVSRI